MNYIAGIFNLLFGLGCIVVGSFGLNQYFGGDEKDLLKYERLRNEGQTTIPHVDTMALEITVKGIKMHQVGYTFDVDGKVYKGTHSFKKYEDLDGLTGLVTYLPSDPTISSLNPEVQLAKAQKAVADNDSSSFGLWLGVGLLLFGSFNLYRAYRKFKGNKPQPRYSPPPIPGNPPRYKESDFV